MRRWILLLTLPGVGSAVLRGAEAPGTAWPSAPIATSAVEGVIESFWNPRLQAATRWQGENGVLTEYWDACFFKMRNHPGGGKARMTRAYELDLGDYQRLRVRLRPGAGVKTRIVAEIDGSPQQVAEHVAATHDALEIVGPIEGQRLTGLSLEFTVLRGAPGLPPENKASGAGKAHAIQLRWVLLEKDGTAWRPPAVPFHGMLVDGPVERLEPGLGLLFGGEGLERLRSVVQSPTFASVWKADLEHAARQYAIDPATLIRPYSLYAHTRYGRDTDVDYATVHDGIILALVGLLTRNEDYLRQAARQAVALAHIDQWAEGFVDRLPGPSWYHSGFAPNVATIKASLLLDWTWHVLTPTGRRLIREAIQEKGLPFVERARDAMANQGVRFAKGMILGKMALAKSLDTPEVRTYVRACIDRLNGKLATVVRPDGTFSEAMNFYGKGTMATTPVSYQAASRCLGVPIADLVSPRMLPAMRYILEADGRLNAPMAAFCAGPLGDDTFTSQVTPTGLLHNFVDEDLPTTTHAGNRIEYIFFGVAALWAPKIESAPTRPALPTFTVYPHGGWVFGGSENSDAPRFRFESGLWDGHGHAWFHKNAVTLDGWGERLLISRMHLPYSDARSQHTMRTRLYNTFAPSGRNQDASGTAGRGARLTVAEDLGPLAVVESDSTTAWQSGVRRAVRRLVFVRPAMLLVQDEAEFTEPETGVQSWNSLRPWQQVGERACGGRVGEVTLRLVALAPRTLQLTTGQDSVSRERGPDGASEVPVYRAAVTTPPSRAHRLLTLIEAIGPGKRSSVVVTRLDKDSVIEVRSPSRVVQLLPARDGAATVGPLEGFESDGSLLFVVREDDKVTQAGTCGARWLQTRGGRIAGHGFLRWEAEEN